ncbi:MAG: hypothetical protein H0T42_14870 [Deltaproteobacteria bacterium]|nr:hypothetical protein [Deltaproteobacteria bacterium]
MLAVRTYVRYLVPLTLLSVIAFAPVILLALRVPVPANGKQAVIALRYAWVFAACSIIPLFLLVGGVAPAVRGMVAGAPRTQLRVLGAGLTGLAGALIPTVIAAAAIAMGSLALVLPGLILIVLLALSGASALEGGPARVADSIAVARTRILPILGVLVAVLAVQAIAIFVLSRQLMPLPKPPKPEHLAGFRQLVRVTVAGIVLAAPIAAVALATIYERARLRLTPAR